MELNIQELDYDYGTDLGQTNYTFEQIPENKVIKNVRFQQQMTPNSIKDIPKEYAHIVRPQTPKFKPQVSYEDILSKMGMFVSEGKLHLIDNNSSKQQPQQRQPQQQQPQQRQPQQQQPQITPQNSYIYNKYFKEELTPQNNIRRPMTKDEYKRMLIEDILQKERIKQIKSRKLIMPTSNINMASSSSRNLNYIFNKGVSK